ncbi:MAG: UDP-glucuronic acid decarboxylase family protein [Candidatus Micrarchaeia archaeon]
MRILVTGGAGFIGSHLCEFLSKKHEVWCLDSLLTGSRKNIAGLNIHFIRHDIARPLPRNIPSPQLIFNLASPASPKDYQEHPIETLLANAFGVKNVLDYALSCGARVLHASTSEVYGDPLQHPQTESYWGNVNPIGPRSCYDEGKRFAEALCMAYHREKRADVVIARIFNTYGPRMRPGDGRVVPNFIVQALAGQPLTIYGSGRQTRSFCYAKDMAEGLAKLAFSKFSGEVFNIGNPKEYSMLELARIVIEETGSKSKIIYKPLPADDPRRRKPDITKITRAVEWRPTTSLRAGLRATIAWFKERV